MTLFIPPIGQVDVWIAKTDLLSGSEHRACEAVLSDFEHTRLANIVAEHFRTQFLIARWLVRVTLSRYVSKEPRAWQFIVNPYGRPRLADGQVTTPLHFNLSHTSGMVTCAISGSEEVGIDVERVDRELNYMSLAQQAFAPPEITRLAWAHGIDKREVFFSHWTLKEAYIKARGMGLSLPLKAFWFEFARGAPKISFSPELVDDPLRWSFQQFSPTEIHRMAVAASFAPGQALRVNLRMA